MIDELEPKTKAVVIRAGGFGVIAWTPDEDVTIRAVYLTVGSLSTDATFDGADTVVGVTSEFVLKFTVSPSFLNLAFPVMAGRSVFFANNTVNNNYCTVIYT